MKFKKVKLSKIYYNNLEKNKNIYFLIISKERGFMIDKHFEVIRRSFRKSFKRIIRIWLKKKKSQFKTYKVGSRMGKGKGVLSTNCFYKIYTGQNIVELTYSFLSINRKLILKKLKNKLPVRSLCKKESNLL